ncbi:hypothetical protein FA95DRAFT_1217343 [Auriscalpium vulgare]|uniref:Uncharacterized protein n=2 Tax=Auriscalpium vulgare TaxID=40419 RepID=A0ACB8R1N6_9AGAM|nr:hypothetical protein FA95DRAFT_1340851 [Auriscalpium vulgare]KAI0038460.1 hypothetical protein FA95DRAFT_1217343 [Auriscalpium vulgare]
MTASLRTKFFCSLHFCHDLWTRSLLHLQFVVEILLQVCPSDALPPVLVHRTSVSPSTARLKHLHTMTPRIARQQSPTRHNGPKRQHPRPVVPAYTPAELEEARLAREEVDAYFCTVDMTGYDRSNPRHFLSVEKFWAEHQKEIAAAGYMLRPRYREGWKPSYARWKLARKWFEDGQRVIGVAVIDGIRHLHTVPPPTRCARSFNLLPLLP